MATDPESIPGTLGMGLEFFAGQHAHIRLHLWGNLVQQIHLLAVALEKWEKTNQEETHEEHAKLCTGCNPMQRYMGQHVG